MATVTCDAYPFHTVLITGGTGTFGNAFTEHLLKKDGVRIRILSRDEYKQAQMASRFQDDRLSFLLGDVRDLDRLQLALRGCDAVVHAAALKHVPAGEYNPLEMKQTNVDGSANVVRAAIDNNVESAVLLSSDKAVNPINTYGATKLVAEKMFIQGNVYSSWTRFNVTRYGNVANSRGSVIEVYKQAMLDGQPLPVTDLSMTRFWMTIKEAVELVDFALCMHTKGGIFVPRLPAFQLYHLILYFLGKRESDGIVENEIRQLGTRPGEKRHERLMTTVEFLHCLQQSGRFYIPPTIANWPPDKLYDWTQPEPVQGPYRSDVWNWQLSLSELGRKVAYYCS